jgi:hypothetical protein
MADRGVEYKTQNGNVATIPTYVDTVDIPVDFVTFADTVLEGTVVAPTQDVVTDTDNNKIFYYKTPAEEELQEVTLTVEDGEYFFDNYGLQFGVATKNDLVTIQPESGVEIQPINTVPKNSLAIITRVSDTLWIIAGGSNFTTTDFIFDKSLMAGGDQFA